MLQGDSKDLRLVLITYTLIAKTTLHGIPCLLALNFARRTGKIIKNAFSVFKKGECEKARRALA